MAVDTEGYIYIADTGHHRIQKWTSQGDWFTTWGGYGEFETPES